MTEESLHRSDYEVSSLIASLAYASEDQKKLLKAAFKIVDPNNEEKVRHVLDHLHHAHLISGDLMKTLLKKLS